MRRRIKTLAAVLPLCCVLAGSVVGLAAQEQEPALEGFVSVSDDELRQEQLPAAPLVFAAYGFVWVALLTYVFVLWRRVAQIERELADVSARLRATEP